MNSERCKTNSLVVASAVYGKCSYRCGRRCFFGSWCNSSKQIGHFWLAPRIHFLVLVRVSPLAYFLQKTTSAKIHSGSRGIMVFTSRNLLHRAGGGSPLSWRPTPPALAIHSSQRTTGLVLCVLRVSKRAAPDNAIKPTVPYCAVPSRVKTGYEWLGGSASLPSHALRTSSPV